MLRSVNALRAGLGLRPVTGATDLFAYTAPLVVYYSAEPFEYPRSDWPASVRLVGPGVWDPPTDPPPWLEEIEGPLVLVTMSTEFQNDHKLVEAAFEALAGEDVNIVVTTGAADPRGSPRPQTPASCASCRTGSCWSARSAWCATVAWASPRRLSRQASRSAPCRSAATSSRSPGASRWPVPEVDCPLPGCGPTGCGRR